MLLFVFIVICFLQSLNCVWLFKTHRLQHARLLCPPLPPRHSNSCSLNWWCHPTIVFSATLFSSYLQSSPASESFPMSRLFTSDGQNMGASASALILPMNIQCGFLLGLAGLISLLSKGLSRAFFSTTVWKHQFFGTPASLWTNTHICTWKTIILTRWTFVGKVMSLLLNMMSRFSHSFSSKEQPSFNFMAAVMVCNDFGAQKDKICHCFNFFLFYLSWSNGTRSHDLCFWNVEFQTSFFSLHFHLQRAFEFLFIFCH